MICPNCACEIKPRRKFGVLKPQYNEGSHQSVVTCQNCGLKYLADYDQIAAVTASAGSVCVVMAISHISTQAKIWGALMLLATSIITIMGMSKNIKVVPFSEARFEEFPCKRCRTIISLKEAKKFTMMGGSHIFYCKACANKKIRFWFWLIGVFAALIIIILLQSLHIL
jgi:RNase P subunit RPR2